MNRLSQSKKDMWLARIMECRKSGVPDTRWCIDNGIPPSSFYYWIKKLRMEAPQVSIPNHEVTTATYKQDVVPLHITEDKFQPIETKGTTAIILHLNAFTLEIQNGANEVTIANTLNALRLLC